MLNPKQKLFVQAYDGDEVMSMRVAGYTGSDAYLKAKAFNLLSNPDVIKAIKDRSKYEVSTVQAIAGREERQALWTAIMRNKDPHRVDEKDSNGVPIPEGNIPLATRLKASELLGKSEADFVDKIDLNGNVTITDIITQSYSTIGDNTEDLEAIEAEYTALLDKKEMQEKMMPSETKKDLDIEDFV